MINQRATLFLNSSTGWQHRLAKNKLVPSLKLFLRQNLTVPLLTKLVDR